jgi:hypothetical protein
VQIGGLNSKRRGDFKVKHNYGTASIPRNIEAGHKIRTIGCLEFIQRWIDLGFKKVSL